MTRTKHLLAVASVAALGALAACAPPAPTVPMPPSPSPTVPPEPPTPPEGWAQEFITRDGADVTTIVDTGDGVRVTAPRTNTGSNSRTVFHRLDAPVAVDQSSCATTTNSGMPVQEGVALRVAASEDGRGTRWITVQKNVVYGLHWTYNVHLWDSSREGRNGPGTSVALIAQYELHEAITDAWLPSQPRRLCARVAGERLELKVWGASRPEPAWDDPIHSREVDLPAGWMFAGQPGLYVGHVPGGGHATFDDLSFEALDLEDLALEDLPVEAP
jgi:hypothetical protein